mmetsp:Transcript_150676/g.280956  ORF Transcript_150676/g.280956 Transcript_150676/m.280956 type:complete len:216 (+) Transcript_150676:331-978(+)
MKRPPNDFRESLTSCEFAVCTSKCSGATRLVTSIASAMSLVRIAKPPRTAGMATSRVGSTSSCSFKALFTLATTEASGVTKIGLASTSCSACASKSAATTSGSAVLSATTNTSLGPASMSMPQMPLTMDFAAVTHLFPGPTIMSQAPIPTPWAIAAIACAPPMAKRQSAPAMYAAPLVTSEGFGEATTTSATPAVRAVQAVINTDDGKGYLPPGA